MLWKVLHFHGVSECGYITRYEVSVITSHVMWISGKQSLYISNITKYQTECFNVCKSHHSAVELTVSSVVYICFIAVITSHPPHILLLFYYVTNNTQLLVCFFFHACFNSWHAHVIMRFVVVVALTWCRPPTNQIAFRYSMTLSTLPIAMVRFSSRNVKRPICGNFLKLSMQTGPWVCIRAITVWSWNWK